MGYNSKVTKHNYGISGRSSLGKTSMGIDAREFMESKNRRDQQAVLEASIKERDNVVKQVGLLENVNARKVGDKQASFIMSDMTKAGRDYAFKYAMGVIFENCLLLDEYYVKENSSKIRSVMESYIEQNGGITLLENALKTNKTRFLTMLMEACNKTASKCAKRKVKEAEEAGQTNGIKFDMTDEEREELDTEISAMDVEQLSSVVKDKVLTVIKDEKERAQQREEFEKELAEGSEDAIVKEQTFKANYKYCSAKDSLFNAFMTESYKDVLESIVQFDMDSSDEVDEIGIDRDEVDYDDNNAHSLSELDKNDKEPTVKDFRDGDDVDNFTDIPDEYDDSLSLDGSDEIINESFMDTIAIYDKYYINTVKKNNEKQQAANFKFYSKKSKEDLESLKAKKLEKLDAFKKEFANYDDTSKISQGVKNVLQLSLTPGVMSFLPAHLQSKCYLDFSIWLAQEEIKTINKVLATKKKGVTESFEPTDYDELESILTEAEIISKWDESAINDVKANNGWMQENNLKEFRKQSLSKLEKTKAKWEKDLEKLNNSLKNYDESPEFVKSSKETLQKLLSGLSLSLPAKLQGKTYLKLSIWIYKEQLKTINKAISEKKKGVTESALDMAEEFEIQLEGFDTFERIEVIDLCQRNSFEELIEASLKAEELVYSLESKLAKEQAKSDEEKEKELEDAEATYGTSLAKNYVGEAKVLAELENARKRHKCVEKAVQLKPEIPECKGKGSEDETEEAFLAKRQARKMAKRRRNKITKKALVMDQVMAEALTKYTLLETLYTVKLENYTVRDVMDLSVRLTSQK